MHMTHIILTQRYLYKEHSMNNVNQIKLSSSQAIHNLPSVSSRRRLRKVWAAAR